MTRGSSGEELAVTRVLIEMRIKHSQRAGRASLPTDARRR
jgi:hypothetical protein